MSNNRRDFLKLSGLAGIGLMGAGMLNSCTGPEKKTEKAGTSAKAYSQQFNMCGYAAPKLETVRVGIIGLGMRGPGAVSRMNRIEGVEIKALCDIRQEQAEAAKKILEGSIHNPDLYYGSEDAWKKACERDDIDLIYIATPWHLHTPMAVYAMEHGKHAAVEVPAAKTLDECWQLVETSERTKKHCMMLENCCYDFFELLTLNMARQGLFGEVVHVEGAYLHNLVDLNFSKEGYYDMWRLKENASRNGNLYPTHGLGPICQILNVNRGDRMDYLVSVSGNDFTMGSKAKELAAADPFFQEYANKSYRGNMNTTTIRTVNGKTVLVQHDVSSTRPYSRIHQVTGTKGSACKWPGPPRIAVSHEDWVGTEEFKKLEEQYTPELVKLVGDMAKKIGGHGGMDFLMDWRLIDCLRNGLPLDQDVYDAALWSSIAPLSEWSVANRSNSIDVPDFTCGAWKTNSPVDISLRGGGNTGVRV